MPGTFADDAATTASVKSGIQGNPQSGSALTGSSNSNKPLPNEPGTGATGTGFNTAGPHSSNLENKMDPRVDSDRDGSRGLGRDAGTGVGDGSTSRNLPTRGINK